MTTDEYNRYQRNRYLERKKQKLGVKLSVDLHDVSEHASLKMLE